MDFIKKIMKLLFSKEMILYVVFGVMTTLVNLVVFKISEILLGVELYLVSNTIAWIISVLFAYVTNKTFVFEKNDWSLKTVKKELPSFVSSRIATYFVEQIGLWIFIDLLSFDDKVFNLIVTKLSGTITAKLILGVIVVALNYIFSKFIIFKNKSTEK